MYKFLNFYQFKLREKFVEKQKLQNNFLLRKDDICQNINICQYLRDDKEEMIRKM